MRHKLPKKVLLFLKVSTFSILASCSEIVASGTKLEETRILTKQISHLIEKRSLNNISETEKVLSVRFDEAVLKTGKAVQLLTTSNDTIYYRVSPYEGQGHQSNVAILALSVAGNPCITLNQIRAALSNDHWVYAQRTIAVPHRTPPSFILAEFSSAEGVLSFSQDSAGCIFKITAEQKR